MALSGPITSPPQWDGLSPSERLLSRLERHKATGTGKWMACCPAHDDHTPSLSVKEEADGKLLIHCFAGCATTDVLEAVGLQAGDLFPADPEWHHNNHRVAASPAVRLAETVIDIARADTDAGKQLSDDDRNQVAQAMATLMKAGIRPTWEIPEPAKEYPLPPTLTEFKALAFPPTEPLLGPISTQQLSLLYAPAGVGKTMFALAMAWSLSNGVDFLGWKSHRTARVLYIDGEMVADSMQARMRLVESDNLHIANLMGWGATHDMEPLNLATEEGHTVMLQWVRALAIEYVFLDNLMALAWVDGVSMNSDEAWQPVRRLLMMLRKEGVSVLVVDHANSSGQVFGTKTKLWHVNLAMRMSYVEPEDEDVFESFAGRVPGKKAPRFRLTFDKKRDLTVPRENGGTEGDDLVVSVGDVGQQWTVEEGGDVMARNAREMKQNGMSIREIAEELGVSKSKAGRWCKGF